MKEIKDYLHLYLGCEVSEVMSLGHSNYVLTSNQLHSCYKAIEKEGHKIFPILRPLNDMIDKEKQNSPKIAIDKWGNPTIESMANLINYLRSIFIDCDGLIESSLAIDKTMEDKDFL